MVAIAGALSFRMPHAILSHACVVGMSRGSMLQENMRADWLASALKRAEEAGVTHERGFPRGKKWKSKGKAKARK